MLDVGSNKLGKKQGDNQGIHFRLKASHMGLSLMIANIQYDC
jgi:hypothetical protein